MLDFLCPASKSQEMDTVGADALLPAFCPCIFLSFQRMV